MWAMIKQMLKVLVTLVGRVSAVVVICIGLLVVWTLFLTAENSWRVFWTVSRPHYKISFAIQTPEGERSRAIGRRNCVTMG